MKKIFIYTSDKSDEPYSELVIAESAQEIHVSGRLFAVFESPIMDKTLDPVLRIVNWPRDMEDKQWVNGSAISARVLCTRIFDAFAHLINVPFVCRRVVDIEFTDNGETVFRHGMKSATITYKPSSSRLRIK